MTSHRPTLIVTGVSRGIGRSIAIFAIQKFDANVIGVARSEEGLQKLSQHIENDLNLKDRFKFVAGDVTDESTSQEAVALALNSWSGKLNGLVLNAGVIDPIGSIATASVKEWKKTFDLNLFACLTTLQQALPALRESKGRVIFLSSGVAFMALHGWGAYCSTKAALKMFADVFAMEEPELTTISIRPGLVDTDMVGTVRKEGVENMTPDQYAMFASERTDKSLPVIHPDVPGHIIASLAINAPTSLNGKNLNWDDEVLRTHRN